MKSIKWFIVGFILFIKNSLSSDKPESSKRFMGSIITINSLILVDTCTIYNLKVPDFATTLFWGGIILLGVEVAGNIFNNFNKK